MLSEELKNYIDEAKKFGIANEQIRRELLNSGWKEEDINSFFKTDPEDKMSDLLSATQLLEAAFRKLRERYKQAFQIVLIFAILAVLSVVFSGFDESLIFITASIVLNLLLVISSLITAISLVYLFGKDEILTLVEYFKLGFYKFWSYIWISIISGFIIFGGYILLIVPGILFGVWFSMSYYALILEDRRGMEALMRSRHLIAGKFWATIWRLVFWGLVTAVLFIPFVVLDFLVEPDLSWMYSILGIILLPLGAAYYVSFFKNLVEAKKEPFIYDKKQARKYIITAVAGILLLVGLLAFGGYYYFTKIKPLLQTPTPTLTYSPTADPTSNWQTYRNEEYGFEFKYPGNLYAAEDEYSFRINSSPLELYTGGGVGPEGIEGKDWVKGYVIWVGKEDAKNVNLVSEGEYQVVKLNSPNIEAYAISADVPSSGPDVYIKNPKTQNSFIRIGYNNGLSTSEEVDKIFNQILSTFKFIPSTPLRTSEPIVCIQVITPARNPQTGETRDFPTPCDVPEGWEKI